MNEIHSVMKERADFVVSLFNVRPCGPLDPEDINPLTGRLFSFLYGQRRLCAFKGDHDYHILRFRLRCDISEQFMAPFYVNKKS